MMPNTMIQAYAMLFAFVVLLIVFAFLYEVFKAAFESRGKKKESRDYFIMPTRDNTTLGDIAEALHYPDCWDTMAYPTLLDAITEISYCDTCDERSKNGN